MNMDLPKHLGIILDGNRRWAKQQGMKAFLGHEEGAETADKLFDWLIDFGIKETTLYTFSTENFTRSKVEVECFMRLLREKLLKLKTDKRLTKHDVRITFVGRLGMFPDDIEQMMYEIMEQTRKHKTFVVNFAMGYGGRAEIVDAVREIAVAARDANLEIAEIDETFLQEKLYVKKDMDLVIRPGGMQRMSNFFPWQTAYAEWVFVDKMWPEFTKKDLHDCLVEFSRRERRHGK